MTFGENIMLVFLVLYFILHTVWILLIKKLYYQFILAFEGSIGILFICPIISMVYKHLPPVIKKICIILYYSLYFFPSLDEPQIVQSSLLIGNLVDTKCMPGI